MDDSHEEGLADSTQAQEFPAIDMIPATDTETPVLREAPAASEAAREIPAAPDSVLDAPAAVPVADSLGPQ